MNKPVKGSPSVTSGKISTVSAPSSTGSKGGISTLVSSVGNKASKVSSTLGNLASKTSSAIKTVATSSGSHLVKSAAPRTAAMSTVTIGLGTFLGSLLLVASTMAVGYLTYIGIRELAVEKKPEVS